MSACCPIVNRLTEKAPLFAFALILTVSASLIAIYLKENIGRT